MQTAKQESTKPNLSTTLQNCKISGVAVSKLKIQRSSRTSFVLCHDNQLLIKQRGLIYSPGGALTFPLLVKAMLWRFVYHSAFKRKHLNCTSAACWKPQKTKVNVNEGLKGAMMTMPHQQNISVRLQTQAALVTSTDFTSKK